MLDLEPPLTLAAHLAGRMDQLNTIFTQLGEPSSQTPYLFLGNYLNRGKAHCCVSDRQRTCGVRHPCGVLGYKGPVQNLGCQMGRQTKSIEMYQDPPRGVYL